MNKRIGTFWGKKDKNGNKYLSGVIDLGIIGEIRVMIFKNDKKEKDNHPDYYAVLPTENNTNIEDTPE